LNNYGCGDATYIITSLDLAVGDLHIVAAGDVDAVGVRTRARSGDGQACHLYVTAVLNGHVDLLAVDDLQILHSQTRAVVERQSRWGLLARLQK